jgi:two-component system sensor kinase FixL
MRCREILRDIAADDRRASEIIQRLRQLFQRGEIQRQQINVNELVRHVLHLAHRGLVSKDVDLHTALAQELPLISGDSVPLQQLLLNLITNACNAMSDVGAPGRRLIVRTSFALGEGVRVTVSDSGHGIPDDNLERIFEPFFTTRPEGMGLGLTVCRTIISVHGGRLWAENNPDRGASFHFILPESDKDQA